MNKKTREALRAALPRLESLADLLDWIATKRDCQDASPEYKPPLGWHTIRVGGGRSGAMGPEPDMLRTWARLFEEYAHGRHGKVIWKDVVHYDDEMSEIRARFCITP